MVPTTLHYPSLDTSRELTLRLPEDCAAEASNFRQAIRATAYDDAFAVMSIGGLVIAGAFAFYDLFGIQ